MDDTPSYEIARVPRTVVGRNAPGTIGDVVRSLGAGSVVLIADGAVVATGYAQRLIDGLAPLPTVLHVVPAGEPTIGSVDAAAAEVAVAGDCVVVGVGGGSALDIAKQAAVASQGGGGIEPYLLCATPFAGRRPIVAIPTTSGTGAEATRTCILADRGGNKVWTWGDEMLPDVVMLDPESAATMPHAVTVGTGLDAFVHAIEACTGQRRSNAAALAMGQRALHQVVLTLPRVCTDGADLAARQSMQEAAFLAGVAIDNCGTGAAHSIGHALGTLYHVPHGVSVAVGLAATVRWNIEGDETAYADAAAAVGCAIDALPSVFASLASTCGFADVVRRVAVPTMDAGDICRTMAAPENQPMLLNNARAIDDDDRMMLAESTIAEWTSLVSS